MNNDKYFNKEKQAIALKWLEKKWPADNRKCEICLQENWNISQDIVSPPIFTDSSSLVLGGIAYPQFMILCNTCGNTKYINAVIAGIVKEKIPHGS